MVSPDAVGIGMNRDSVSSGRFQYPCARPDPEIQRLPGTPGGSGGPSSDRIWTPVLAIGVPIRMRYGFCGTSQIVDQTVVSVGP